MNKYQTVARLAWKRGRFDRAVALAAQRRAESDPSANGSANIDVILEPSEMLFGLLPNIDTLDRLAKFAVLLTLLQRRSRLRPQFDKGLAAASLRSPRQWAYYARKTGLASHEVESLETTVQNAYAMSLEQVEALNVQISIDGNTVRTIGGRSRVHKATQGPTIPVEIWLSDTVSEVEALQLQAALTDVLIEADLEFVDSHEPIHGSYYQLLKYVGSLATDYGRTLVANLKSAFGQTALNAELESVGRLSEIVAKHDNVCIRIGNIVAVKVTRQTEAHVIILELRPALAAALAAEPALVRNPDRLYDLLISSQESPVDSSSVERKRASKP
jgi:hypothetical protein